MPKYRAGHLLVCGGAERPVFASRLWVTHPIQAFAIAVAGRVIQNIDTFPLLALLAVFGPIALPLLAGLAFPTGGLAGASGLGIVRMR